MSQSIFDIPEHERRFPSHPDTLRGKEEAVIEAAIACKYAAARNNEPLSKYGFSVELERAVCALIAAREKQ